MNSLVVDFYHSSGLYAIVESFKSLTESDTDIALEHVLLISRVLFAVVMIGFVGHFFEKTKQTVKNAVISKK